MTNAERQQRLAQFHAVHRSAGLPVTTQRLAVFEAVLERDDHPAADAVYAEVRQRQPRIARMTVYRVLTGFARLGLIARTCHPGAATRFDPKIHRHHHLVCRDCDGIIDLESAELNRVSFPDVRRLGFEIEDYHIHFRGRCAACRSAAMKSKKPRTKRSQPS